MSRAALDALLEAVKGFRPLAGMCCVKAFYKPAVQEALLPSPGGDVLCRPIYWMA